MIIRFSPVRAEAPLHLVRRGDTLVIDGTAFDLGANDLGAQPCADDLGAQSCATPDSPHFPEPITRTEDGVLCVVLRLPHGANAPHETLFPSPLIDPPDGEVTLPAYDGRTPQA